MKLNILGGLLAVLVLIGLVVVYGSTFTVYQTDQAIVVQLGQPIRVVTEPGLHFKWPVVQSVISIDKRILDLENPAQEVIASDGERLVVDAFARYRISDPLKFYQTIGAIESANARLSPLLNSSLRRVLGSNRKIEIVRDKRAQLMADVRTQLGNEAKAFGVEVVDARIRRADLPEQNSQAVYKRMQTEREREAQEFRSQGTQKAQEIRARADRDATVIVAEATSKSEQTRGQGDAERNRIFAEAFSKDADFFAFYRSMQAYDASLKQGDTRFVVRPDSNFFRYFSDPKGKQSGAPSASARTPPAPAPSASR